MNAPDLSLPSPSPAVEASFLRAVLQGVSWRKVAVAGTIGLALGALDFLNSGTDAPPHALETALILNSVGALFILVGAVTTDEAIRRGARMIVACPLALVIASFCAAILQWELRGWLGVIDFAPDSGSPPARILSAFMAIAVPGGFGMMAYLQRQNAQRLVESMRARELRRVQAERQLLEANLTMTRSQVDRGALLRQLLLIRNAYAAGQSAAEMELDTLIQDLRTRVAHSPALTRAPQLRP